jgi:hypothetical protein
VPPEAGQAKVWQLSRQGAHRLVGVTAGQKTLKPELGVPADQLGDLADRSLRQPAGCLKWQGLGAKAELKYDFTGVGRQCRQERFVDIRCIAIPLGRPRLRTTSQRPGHLVVRDRSIVDVGRQMGCHRKNPAIRDKESPP